MKNLLKKIFLAISLIAVGSIFNTYAYEQKECSARCIEACKGPITYCQEERTNQPGSNFCYCAYTQDYQDKLRDAMIKEKIAEYSLEAPAGFTTSTDVKIGNEACAKGCEKVFKKQSVKGPSGRFFEYEDMPEYKKSKADGKTVSYINCYCKG